MDKFTSGHFAFLILGVSVVSLKTYPGIYLRNGERESWVAIIVASIIIYLIYLYIINISEKNNRPNICKVYQTALGKNLSKVLLLFYVATLVITLVECSSVEANSMHENMLEETPCWYLLLFFIVPCIYVVSRNIVAIITITVVGISLIVIVGINLAFLTAPYKHFSLLLPIFRKGININFLICITKMVGLYGSVSIVLPYLFRIGGSKRSMLKGTMVGLFMLIQMQIISVVGLIMTFVPSRLTSYNYPKLIQTQLVSFSQFIEFGELYVMLQILGGWLLKYIITFYAILVILTNLNVNRKYFKYIIFSLSAFVYVGAYFTSKNLYILYKLLNYYAYLCLVNFILIPFVVYTLLNIKNKNISN